MLSFLAPFFGAIIAALLGYWLRTALRSAKPFVQQGERGTIRPDRWSGWIVTLLGVLMAVGSTWAVFFSPVGALAIVGILMGACLAAFMSPSVTSIHAVNWNSDGIEGPAKTFGGTLGMDRTSIAWSDGVSSGKTPTLYWYVEASDGRRVHWSYLYPGYTHLTAAIREHCPSLSLPEDMT